MRLRRVGACLLVLATFAAAPAGAATLAFTGTLTLQLVHSNPNTVVPVAGSGLAQVTGGLHLSSLTLPGTTFGPITTKIDLGFATGTDLSLVGVVNQSGQFTGGAGVLGFSGVAKLCFALFDPTCLFANLLFPFAATGTPAKGFGIGGTQVTAGAVGVTAKHAPWTTGQPVLSIHWPNSTVTIPPLPGGFAHGPASLTSSTAQPGGVLQLVTATRVFTSLTAAFPELSQYGILELHFVPEPGTLLLLASGGLGLALLGRRRGS